MLPWADQVSTHEKDVGDSLSQQCMAVTQPGWGGVHECSPGWDLILIGKQRHSNSCSKDPGQKEPGGGDVFLLSSLITPCRLLYIWHQTYMFLQIRRVSFIQQGESQNSYLCLCTKNAAAQEAFKWWLLFVLPDNVLKMDDNSQTASSIA